MSAYLSKDGKTELIFVAGINTGYIIRHHGTKHNYTATPIEYRTINYSEAMEQFHYVNKNGEFFSPQA